MNAKNSFYGAVLAAAMMVTMVPGKALAKGGADDVIPGAGHPVQLAKGGADDVIPGAGHPVA
jgi:hypothetical protein